MIDSIIFDMDGTLVNNLDSLTSAWNKTCEKYHWNKHFTTEQVQSVMGQNALNIGLTLFNEGPITSKEKAEILICEQAPYLKKVKGNTYIPNEEFLIKLNKKYQLFIVSNCLEGYIENFLAQYHYEKYFTYYLNSSNGNTKSENILELVNKFHLSNPIYVGDTQLDYTEAKKAKVRFIYASYGFGKVKTNDKIDNLSELLNL